MEPFEIISQNDTIAAISTPHGTGGIAVIRVSGPRAIEIVNNAWMGTDLSSVISHTAHLGKFKSTEGSILDEAVVTLYKAPASFTGEDTIELSVHGSMWIQREILADLIRRGVRIANPGEFTQRAYLNGKLDLAQAEGIADLIASSSKAAHDLALNQTRGKFSMEFNTLRHKLIEFSSLLELELDFSEEDVEFADRNKLLLLCDEILEKINKLIKSYSQGAVLKNGVPVVIAGIPNAGKSSLLNLLLNDDKAIVTEIPGTTRDTIEDTIEIDGILYRFIDTAGIRDTDDLVEEIGVNRAYAALEKAFIVIWTIDPTSPLQPQLQALNSFVETHPFKPVITLINKSDLLPLDFNPENLIQSLPKSDKSHKSGCQNEIRNSSVSLSETKGQANLDCISNSTSIELLRSAILFSTFNHEGLDQLVSRLTKLSVNKSDPESDVIITNARHYESLTKAAEALEKARENLTAQISGDFIAQDIREAIAHLYSLTGAITSTSLLDSIFSHFCIGK